VPLQRLGTVEEVASAYVFLMTNGFITGQVLAVDGGVMLRKSGRDIAALQVKTYAIGGATGDGVVASTGLAFYAINFPRSMSIIVVSR
jgi:hypothetical protein